MTIGRHLGQCQLEMGFSDGIVVAVASGGKLHHELFQNGWKAGMEQNRVEEGWTGPRRRVQIVTDSALYPMLPLESSVLHPLKGGHRSEKIHWD